MAGFSDTRSKSHLLDQRRQGNQRERCGGITKRGTPCRLWAISGSDYCHMHQDGGGAAEPKSETTAIPSTLPGMTDSQVYANERAIQYQIADKKRSREKQEVRKAASDQRKAENGAKAIAKTAGIIVESDLKLRTLEDCLLLIEYAVDEILDEPVSLGKSKTLIQAARTAGQLIIQAGIADKAVNWFMDNVKLVAGIDLDQV